MIASVEHVTFAYPGESRPAVADVTVSVEPGEFVLVAGESGGGKSTLLRLFNGLVPQFYGGRYAGSVRVGGLDPSVTPARRMATVAGMVFQEPEAQGITDVVEDEIAFGMEQQGIARPTMLARTARVLDELGIAHLRRRRLATLSGGERQRVAIAAILALEPGILLLDEPASQLDAAGARAVAGALRSLTARGLAVVVAEHRYEHFLPPARSVWTVSDGRATRLPATEFRPLDPFVPDRGGPLPSPGAALLDVRQLSVSYPGGGGLRDVDLVVREGEIVALAGPNGSGKTTLLRAIAGLLRPLSGEVCFSGRAAPQSVAERSEFIGFVPQNPALVLYRDTVAGELRESLQSRSRGQRADEALRAWAIDALAARNPRDLSVGQQQRVAIAAMLAHEPPIWLLDEPTRGADVATRAWLADRLRDHATAGGAVVVATHDLRWAASFATRVVSLDGGRVQADRAPRSLAASAFR